MEALTERYGRTAYGVRLGGYRVLLVPDDDAENPRTWDNFGTLWIRPGAGNFRNDYAHLGDPDLADIDSAWIYFVNESPAMQTFGSVQLAHRAFARWLRMVKGATHIKSVSVYEHSGMTIRYQKANYIEQPSDWGHGSFDALIFDTAEGYKLCNPKSEAQVREWLTAELDATKAYVEGEVYVVVTEQHGDCDDGPDCQDNECSSWQEVDSFGGYYGDAESDAYQALAELYLTKPMNV